MAFMDAPVFLLVDLFALSAEPKASCRIYGDATIGLKATIVAAMSGK
jgi:hypothetical protein